MATPNPKFVTSTDIMNALGLNRGQSQKLMRSGWLPVVGHVGRTALADATALRQLSKVKFLPSGSGKPRGIIVHTDGLAKDDDRTNKRPAAGWTHAGAAPPMTLTAADRRKAWTAWWNTGYKLAEDMQGLMLLQSTSGFIGEAVEIIDWAKHSVRPGLVWFQVQPVAPAVAARYLGHRITPRAGAPWERF